MTVDLSMYRKPRALTLAPMQRSLRMQMAKPRTISGWLADSFLSRPENVHKEMKTAHGTAFFCAFVEALLLCDSG